MPILSLSYALEGTTHTIRVYPTLQFLYSHHIQAKYINQGVHDLLSAYDDAASFCLGSAFCGQAELSFRRYQSGQEAAKLYYEPRVNILQHGHDVCATKYGRLA